MNKVYLIGNLTRDPEISTTSSGVSVCRFSVAISRRFTNAEGERETDFVNIVAWRTLGENCYKYLKKGSKAAIIGSIQSRTFDAQDGSKRFVTEVVADEVEFVGTKPAGDVGDDIGLTENQAPAEKTATKLQPIEDDQLPF